MQPTGTPALNQSFIARIRVLQMALDTADGNAYQRLVAAKPLLEEIYQTPWDLPRPVDMDWNAFVQPWRYIDIAAREHDGPYSIEGDRTLRPRNPADIEARFRAFVQRLSARRDSRTIATA